MSAQKFLEKYEQDQCEYWRKYYNSGVILYSDEPVSDPHDPRIAKISAYIMSGELLKVGAFNDFEIEDINFCPMCGKKLINEK